MLNFFKKKSKANLVLQVELISKICELLPDKFQNLRDQVRAGIIKDIKLLEKPFPNYHRFTLDVEILNKYEDKKGRSFVIKGILVNDKSLQKFVPVNLIVAYGILLGYSIPQANNFEPDLEKIVLTSISLDFFGEGTFDKIRSILSQEELKWISPSDVYEVEINDTCYYHLKDLEDGDFIAIDVDKNVFKVTHDPFELERVSDDLDQILSSVFNG